MMLRVTKAVGNFCFRDIRVEFLETLFTDDRYEGVGLLGVITTTN
jgi:hypothetical protein